MAIKFGTDGWRGLIGEDYPLDTVRLCAQGTARLLTENPDENRPLIVGYDTRRGSLKFARAVAEVGAANGITVLLTDRVTPTPVISYNLVARNARGGVVITASHNPPEWNGYKFKPDYGGSASPDVVDRLECFIAEVESTGVAKRIPLRAAEDQGLVTYIDPEPLYMENIERLIDIQAIRDAGLVVIVDSMHGAGGVYFNKILSGGSTVVKEIRGEPNPAFPGMAQPEPLAGNLSQLMGDVVGQGAHIGIAMDGDADRLGVVDENGRFMTTLETFALLCYYQLEILGNRGPLVRSITMTSMVDKLGGLYGVPVFDTKVGFKYLGPLMAEHDAIAAGEESGGDAFIGNIPERDGILSGLMVLDMMVKTGNSLSALSAVLGRKVGSHHYKRVDLSFNEDDRTLIKQRIVECLPDHLGGKPVKTVDVRDGVRFVLEDGYWVLIRFSGTEPILRVYAEDDSPEGVDRLLQEAQDLARI